MSQQAQCGDTRHTLGSQRRADNDSRTEGNATILCKLLDKILPTLNSNNNIVESKMTLEDYILQRKNRDEQRN